MSGAKLLCQGFDGIQNETRATGSSSVTIERGTISLLGTSTGDKLWTDTFRFAQDYGSDGLAVRFSYHILPLLPIVEPPIDFLIFMPNLVHLFIIVILIAQRQPHMVFRQLVSDTDTRPTSINSSVNKHSHATFLFYFRIGTNIYGRNISSTRYRVIARWKNF